MNLSDKKTMTMNGKKTMIHLHFKIKMSLAKKQTSCLILKNIRIIRNPLWLLINSRLNLFTKKNIMIFKIIIITIKKIITRNINRFRVFMVGI